MTSDSVKIAEQNFFDRTVSSKTQFQDVSKAGRKINTGLDNLTMGYITGSHFKPGYGGFSGASEQNVAFSPKQRVENIVAKERI